MTWHLFFDWLGHAFRWAENPAWWALILSVLSCVLAIATWRRTRQPRICFQTEADECPTSQGIFLLRNVGRVSVSNVTFVIDPATIITDESDNPSLLGAVYRRPHFHDDTIGNPPRLIVGQSGRFRLPTAQTERTRVLVTCDQSPAVFSIELAAPGHIGARSTRCAKSLVALYAPWSKIMTQSIDALRPTIEKLVDAITDPAEPEPAPAEQC